jgi:hypothetical protein
VSEIDLLCVRGQRDGECEQAGELGPAMSHPFLLRGGE